MAEELQHRQHENKITNGRLYVFAQVVNVKRYHKLRKQLLPTPTMSVGVGRIFESVCLSVSLFVNFVCFPEA